MPEGSVEETRRRGSSRKRRDAALVRHGAITALVDMLNHRCEHDASPDPGNTQQASTPDRVPAVTSLPLSLLHRPLPPAPAETGFLSLRQEMCEELNRLKRALRREFDTHRDGVVHAAPPRPEITGSQRQDDAEHDDANQPYGFWSLRQEMLVELRRLKRLFGMAPEEDPVAKLSPGERATYDKFMRFFARCPACGRPNHDLYLQDFYFTPGPDKAALRDSLVRLIEKTTDFDHVYGNIKLTIGIPCCNCFKIVFSKSIIKMFLMLQHGVPNNVCFRHPFNNTNPFIAHFAETYARGQYYMLSSDRRSNGAVQRVDSNDYHFFMLGTKRAFYVIMVEGTIPPQEAVKIERLLVLAKQHVEENFGTLLSQPIVNETLLQPVHDAMPGLVQAAGIDI